MSKPSEFPPPPEQPFVSHLIELRDRLMRAVIAILVIFLALFAFANDLYTLLAEPLLRHMPAGTNMIATEVASPFLTPFKLTLVLSVFIAVPYLLYQAWGFIAPALYATEKRLVFPLLLSSTLLFYTGMAFAYFVVFPLVFGFLTGVVPDGVEVMTDISRYLDFVLKLFFAFGIAFEVPIATILVIWSGLTTREELAKKRPYVIVAAFVIGMLLTPPDIISQTLLALPMWFLFEVGLVMSRFYRKSESDEDTEDDTNNTPDKDPDDDKPSGPTGAAPAPSNSDSTDLAVKNKGRTSAASATSTSKSALKPTANLDQTPGLADAVNHDDSPGSAEHYSELGDAYEESSDEDMEREFDRLEAEEEDQENTVMHPEFEPIEEERTRVADQQTAANTPIGTLDDLSTEEPTKVSDQSDPVKEDDQATPTDPKIT